MNSSAMIWMPGMRFANGCSESSGPTSFHTPLPSYPPREVLAITGQPVPVAEGSQLSGVRDDLIGRAGSTERAEPISHDRLVLGVDEGVRTGADGDTGVLEVVEQLGRYVLVVEA